MAAMTQDALIRHIAAATLSLTDEERDGLANCVGHEIAKVMRVRRLKAEAGRPTLPTLDEKIGAECFGGRSEYE